MSTEIYLMRHGETLFNRMHLEQGQCDSPLTENGIHQAEKARQWFEAEHIHFDSCYSSTLERACDTMEIITDHPYIRRHDLKEINLGIKEATSIAEEPPYPYGDYYVQLGGEDLDAFTRRIHNAVQNIAEAENNNVILIVTHGTAMRRFLCSIDYPKDTRLPNCGIIHLLYNHGIFEVKEIIDPLNNY